MRAQRNVNFTGQITLKGGAFSLKKLSINFKSRRFRCKNVTRTSSSADPFDQNFNQTWYRASQISYIDDFQKSSLEPLIQPNLAQIVTLDFSCTWYSDIFLKFLYCYSNFMSGERCSLWYVNLLVKGKRPLYDTVYAWIYPEQFLVIFIQKMHIKSFLHLLTRTNN